MKRNRKLVRIVAIVLAALLIGGVVFGALVSALAEAPAGIQAAERDRYELSMEYLEEEQALRIEQRLVYVNRTGERLDRVMFYAAANMFRREDALMYESDDLEAVFPEGYVPGGIDLQAARVDGADAEYGFQGEDELYLRVACDLEPGARATFAFDYYLLLTRCGAFIGAGDGDVRLSAFYFIPGVYGARYHEFALSEPLPFARWLYTDAADYDVELTLPDGWDVASVGTATRDGGAWHISAENAREFALSFSRRWRAAEAATDSGVTVRVLSGARDSKCALDAAVAAIEQCEAWFGPFPASELDIAASDYPLGALNFPGLILLSGGLFDRSRASELERRVRFCVAQQYFGLSAYVEPSADAWLSDSVSAYVGYLLLEAAEGRDAFLAAVNRDWVSALQLTIPGGLRVTSDAKLFDAYEYEIVVLNRGAVVLHELREAMGLEKLLEGLAAFFRMGRDGRTLGEMDFVACMDAVSGRSWEDFLTDWVFNVGDYVNQTIDWFS